LLKYAIGEDIRAFKPVRTTRASKLRSPPQECASNGSDVLNV
jgi:hypothetical protein